METIFSYVWNLLYQTVAEVIRTLLHNSLILTFSVVTAVALKTYMATEKISNALLKHKKVSIAASVAVGAFTPFCACGTMAVVIGMLSTVLPWGPVMAFLTSSPLMSPNGFIMTAGVIGLRFAIALTVASLVIGFASGFVTNAIERKTRFLNNQFRYTGKQAPVSVSSESAQAVSPGAGCACAVRTALPESAQAISPGAGCACAARPAVQADCSCTSGQANLARKAVWTQKLKLREFAQNLFNIGVKQVLLYFSVFVAVGYLINTFVPANLISALFGIQSAAAVPLAAAIGVPLYVTTQSALPIIQSLLQSGASEGAMLAFMITGSATSAWVIAGLMTFLKKRAVALYLLYIFAGAVLLGYLYDFVLLFI
jgi:uncharacterized membrane protein YraQ (UPF0718 family)